MPRALMVTALLILGCGACATAGKAPTDARLEEAQKAFDEGKRLKEAGKYAEAIALIEHALELRETALTGPQPKVADCLALLGELHTYKADYARAESLIARALEIREKTLGANHPDVAGSLNDLAANAFGQGRYERAESLFARALEIRERALGANHPEVASTLYNLATLYQSQGRYERAASLSTRAIKIWEEALGENHPYVAAALNTLATVYHSQGLYARASPLYERALKIREATLGENHPSVAGTLNNLAVLYAAQGVLERAERLYERALRIQEATLGENHPAVANSVSNLAALYLAHELYDRAEPWLVRGLKMREAALGETHPQVSLSLNNLAFLYHAQGLYARAEPLYERALKLQETALGENHPDVARLLHNLARLYAAQGLHERAEPLFARALKIAEATLGEDHPDVASLIQSIALLRLTQQRLDEALPLFQRALNASEHHLRQEVFGFSEKRLASFLFHLRGSEERLYALARAHPDDTRVLSLALSAALLRKGRSVQEIANTSHIINRSLEDSDRETFERLRALRTQLATLSLAGPGQLPPTDYQRRLKDLADKGDSLEADLARRSEPLRRFLLLPSPDQLVSRVTAALPSNSALVEFVTYLDRPLRPDAGMSAPPAESNMRYLAFLLFADGRIRAVDVGLAEPIDRAALRLYGALVGQSASYLSAAQALYTLAFRPLIPYLGKKQRLFLAPEGQLSLVPFDALHDGRRFLVDAFDISYLTSGKDLLPRSERPPTPRGIVVLADPDFGAAQVPPQNAERSGSLESFFSTLRSEGPDAPWTPLPGTRQEAEAIQRLFPQAQLLLGPDANKDALLKVPTPGVLHIATHGFFLEDGPRPPDARAVGYIGAVVASPEARPADPLLRSGLVLAGAQAPPGSHHPVDALVTALELAGMNLWGTQLVVLSACDTGRGDVKRGEGVYGLRRAFLLAGAETVVTSLWKVKDDATQELMGSYYRHLLAGHGRASSLREAMIELRRKRPHPYFWAAFTTLGLDAPLGIPPEGALLQGVRPALPETPPWGIGSAAECRRNAEGTSSRRAAPPTCDSRRRRSSE